MNTKNEEELYVYDKFITCTCGSVNIKKYYSQYESSGDLFIDLKIVCLSCRKTLLDKNFWMDLPSEAEKIRSIKPTFSEYIQEIEKNINHLEQQTESLNQEIKKLKEKYQ